MPAQIRSLFAPIALKIKTQLITYTGLAEHRVFFRARSKTMTSHPVQSTQYIVLRPHLPRPIGEWTEAAGRTNKGVSRLLEVICRTRLGLDQLDRDDNFLTAETEGHMALEEKVYDALEMYEPEDDTSNILTARPIRCVESPNLPEKDEPIDPQWGESILFFDVWYQLAVDQSRI